MPPGGSKPATPPQLNLGWCFRLSAKALASLVCLPRLISLDLAHTKLDDDSLRALASSLTRLRELSLRGCSISDVGLCRCRHFSRLESLSLRTCEVGNSVVEVLVAMPRLRDLDLAYTELSDAGLCALRPLTRLTSLSLDSCRLSASGLTNLAAFPELRTLDLSDVEAPRFAVEVLASLPHLTSLNLFYVGISDEECVHLTRLVSGVGLESVACFGGHCCSSLSLH